MNKLNIQNISLFIILTALAALLIAIFSPYVSTLFWSVALYILCSPPYRVLIKKLNHGSKTFNLKKKLLAGLFAVGTVVIIAVLLVVFCFLAIRQFIELTERLIRLLNISPGNSSLESLFADISQNIYNFTNGVVDIRSIDIKATIITTVSKYANSIFLLGKNFVQSAGSFVISLLFVCFSLYFFYVDGDYLIKLFASAIPIESNSMTKLLSKFSETLTQLVSGLFLVALYQGMAAFIIYWIFGVQGSFLLGVITFFASFIPLVGSGSIWFPISVVIFFTDSKIKGLMFFVVAGVIISLMDNILRPLLLRDSIKIHPLLIFFSLLGGVKFLGLKGLILGPMAIIIFFAVLDIILNSSETEKVQTETTDIADDISKV